MLLRSRPDMVRRFLLRKTQISTSSKPGSNDKQVPATEHHPCYSGFQVQGAANSPAAWTLIISIFIPYVKAYRIKNGTTEKYCTNRQNMIVFSEKIRRKK